jgi:signal transduction histidine kinase
MPETDGNPVPSNDVRARISREARVAGLKDFRIPTLEAVEGRRLQLWVLTTIILLALSIGTLVTVWASPPSDWPVSPLAMRIGVIVLTAAFAAYAIEKERALRRLTELLVEERVLTAALTNRVQELSTLLEVGKAINSELGLRQVLDIILRSAMELLGGAEGSVMLLESRDTLRVVAVAGNDDARDARVRLGEGIAGKVAQTREPMLVTGRVDAKRFPGRGERSRPVDSAMSVPLVNRGQLLGVLNVNAASGRRFTEYDLRASAIFAEQAAIAITNARLFDFERAHVRELMELNRMKTEFVAAVSHDLRNPLTGIIGSAETLEHLIADEAPRSLLGVIKRQGHNMNSMIGQLMSAAELELRSSVRSLLEPLDLSRLVVEAVGDMAGAGMSPEVDVAPGLFVRADQQAMRRVLTNLVDNAYKHGSGSVRVTVEANGPHVVLSVTDEGPGVAPDQRDRIFETLTRLTPDDAPGGFGLGLGIVRSIVAGCGGSVWVEDAPGGGAAFRVALPALGGFADEAEPAEPVSTNAP